MVTLAVFYFRSKILTWWSRADDGEAGEVIIRAGAVAFPRKPRGCVGAQSMCCTAPAAGPLYNATADIADAIDGLAEVVTGDRRRFYQKDATTPGRACHQ